MEINGIKYWIGILFEDLEGNIIDIIHFKNFDEVNVFLEEKTKNESSHQLSYTFCEDVDGSPEPFSWTFLLDFDKFSDERISEAIQNQLDMIEESIKMSSELDKHEKEIHYFEFDGDSEAKKTHLPEIAYVCPNCINEIEECTCKFYSYYLVQIDREMVPIIQELNSKGYKTVGCCAGHPKDPYSVDIYISFDKEYDFCEPFPEVARYSKLRNTLHIGFPENASVPEREDFQRQALWDLSDWAEMLFENGYFERLHNEIYD